MRYTSCLFFSTNLSLMNCSHREDKLAFREHGLTLMVTSPVWHLPCASYWHVLIPLLENMTIHDVVKRMSYGTSEVEVNKLFNTRSSCWCFSIAFCLGGGKFSGEGREMGKAGREVSAHTYADPSPIPPSRVLSNTPSPAASWFL